MNERDDELERFARRIRAYEQPRASDALRRELRASLLAAPVAPRTSPSLWVRLGVLRPVLAAVVVLALLVGAGGSAAASSLPGDAAYGLKRAVEETQLALTFDDATALTTLVALSDRRLAELQTAGATRPSAIPAATEEYLAMVARVDAAIANASALPRTAARDTAIARAATMSAAHIARLEALATRLPESAQAGIARAIEAQTTVHGRTRGSAPSPAETARPDRPTGLPGGGPGGNGGGPSGGTGPGGGPGRGANPSNTPRR